ncbi:hypothetical protein PVBG_06063 [Plasmodium vivax Brazil I]|uniref:Variable surface protein n=1 Tax=Plasmodium vivax (strain Brazil I) TaxID=1033975 RepID=A0A0J9SJX2_PLAV1|nr:hypothetical protein PVBG_06063 [Plasmodium vivax Brazil I]
MNYFKGNNWNVRNDRLITNDVPMSDIGQSEPTHNLTLLGEKNTLKDISGLSEIHEKIKKYTSNSMYTYIKNLEYGYPNKKGLKRLYFLYQKKLLNEMYKLDKIAGHMKSKISYFKKVILKRHGLHFYVYSLITLCGIIMFVNAILMVSLIIMGTQQS